MPDPSLDPIPTPTAPKTKSELVAELGELRLSYDALLAKYEALTSARPPPPREGGPGRLLGHIPIHDADQPPDVLHRARELFKGNISVDRATRFKTDARLRALDKWPLRTRLGSEEVPIGTEFGADEIPVADRVAWFASGAIVAIA